MISPGLNSNALINLYKYNSFFNPNFIALNGYNWISLFNKKLEKMSHISNRIQILLHVKPFD